MTGRDDDDDGEIDDANRARGRHNHYNSPLPLVKRDYSWNTYIEVNMLA